MRTMIGALVCVLATAVQAQTPNPLADALAVELRTHQTNMMGAAEAMPADKYDYKPTPPQVSFADLIVHAAVANYTLCSSIVGEKPPEAAVKADGTKAALIDQMKQSFAYCEKALPRINPATLGQQIPLYGRTVTRAWVLFHLALDWGDHYSQAAMMLRLNGILPPSATRGRGAS